MGQKNKSVSYQLINGGGLADSLSQLRAVVLGDSVCRGRRDILELSIPGKNTATVIDINGSWTMGNEHRESGSQAGGPVYLLSRRSNTCLVEAKER